MSETVHGLWIQGNLSCLEILTIQSFSANGFTFHLWTYEPESINAPEKTIVRDANDIIPAEQVFSYHNQNIHGHGKGSYAGFSDIFRYKLLYEHGGIWSDMDITCLKAFTLNDAYFFRYHEHSGAVGNFMKCPPRSELMKWCFEQATERVNEQNRDWMLPIQILNDGIKKFQLSAYIHRLSNNDNFPEVAALLAANEALPDDWLIIHWMNEEWRRFKLKKNKASTSGIYFKLLKQYGIPVQPYTFFEKIQFNIKMSRLYYFFVCYYYIYKFKLTGKKAL